MKIVCIGGGPGGLYFAISMKLRDSSHDITVVERNRPDDTFGWGVVFSDQTMDNLRSNDPVSAQTIDESFAHWDDIDTFFKGHKITSGGHGFIGIGRLRLLEILQNRAAELGVNLEFENEIDTLDEFSDADLIVCADGANSRFRTRYAQVFQPDIDMRTNRYVWLGTSRLFEAFTFMFQEIKGGWIQAHAYRFDKETSTFIVECPEDVWRANGCDKMDTKETLAFCEATFREHLQGHSLRSNASHLSGNDWITFPRISNERWHYKNIVLLGDAAHTAHFSIGSGTKLALEDAISLSNVLSKPFESLESAFEEYEEERRIEVLRLQSSARNSTEWFENVRRYVHLEPPQFTYSLLTRSQRVSHENLRLRDKKYLEDLECWFAGQALGHKVDGPLPPMFTPYRLRDLELENRIVVSPMDMYSAADGMPGDFHMVHLGSRALGGAGMIFTEMTCVSAEGRITPGCAGLYRDEHADAWRRIVRFVHGNSRAKIGVQIGHSGPKGSTKLMWDGMDEPLDEGNWEVMGPSDVAWSQRNQRPRPMTRADMDDVRDQFVRSTRMAEAAGFDMIELHCAHGYLLSSFISPLTNQRHDNYGGCLENRLRYPIEIFKAMRRVWPSVKPMSVRISATDWVDDGITGDDAVLIAKAFSEAGADIIDVSAGQTSTRAAPVYGRMFQTPFSDRIKNEAMVPTIAVGNIYEVDHVNSIIMAGRADLCCLGRPHLANPYWTLHAAAEQQFSGIAWPVQYQAGREQLERNLQRAAEMVISI